MTEKDEEMAAEEKKAAVFKVTSFIEPERANKDVQINSAAISEAFYDQASLFLHYATLEARAAHQVDKCKQLLKIVEARVDKMIRDEAAEDGKKLTESMIDKEIQRHPKIVDMTKSLNEARMQLSLVEGVVEAMRHRRDMLVQIGANTRIEMQGEMRLAISDAKKEADAAQRDRVAGMLATKAA